MTRLSRNTRLTHTMRYLRVWMRVNKILWYFPPNWENVYFFLQILTFHITCYNLKLNTAIQRGKKNIITLCLEFISSSWKSAFIQICPLMLLSRKFPLNCLESGKTPYETTQKRKLRSLRLGYPLFTKPLSENLTRLNLKERKKWNGGNFVCI